ncbi:thylakoid lumenal 16.5 kDa protein, chloroplastic [Amborella trichopoda]|uniref:Maintenance of Photosystem II under High light 2 C-terminal domain-containing protein n=1 Tax=Amborella trichopoda TaxID=13333 RepID=W1PTH9_AMBTC|nr:thylakoid lumenal 16.5 kDa protein, chloroplastic [Amborella trichopoda]ERN11353.1 hypothetical protein AMTR_s00024p00252900 [Amborella trichopoda]|eukprot:XP_006849772.3 thylakoid lumenal 16.5 kDa protein, chloroplastic [Amborella trichopoda]
MGIGGVELDHAAAKWVHNNWAERACPRLIPIAFLEVRERTGESAGITMALLLSQFLPNINATSSSSPERVTTTLQSTPTRGRGGGGLNVVCSNMNISRRWSIIGLGGGLFLSLPPVSKSVILEAEDDEELLEMVKRDRKKRLERQGVINSSANETAYLQDLVYKLSRVGEAIDKNDLLTASSVLGPSPDSEWVKNINIAFIKLSSSPEEKSEVDVFNSSLASLISSVSKRDLDSSKGAFVSSASALEKWTSLTGLTGQLKGL